ncbi:MAG: hypothetical protein RLZZ369_2563, partial [Pseudomonadota bacterium]
AIEPLAVTVMGQAAVSGITVLTVNAGLTEADAALPATPTAEAPLAATGAASFLEQAAVFLVKVLHVGGVHARPTPSHIPPGVTTPGLKHRLPATARVPAHS